MTDLRVPALAILIAQRAVVIDENIPADALFRAFPYSPHDIQGAIVSALRSRLPDYTTDQLLDFMKQTTRLMLQLQIFEDLKSQHQHTTNQNQRKLLMAQMAIVQDLKSKPDCTIEKLFDFMEQADYLNIHQAIVKILESRPDCTTDQLLDFMEQTKKLMAKHAIVDALKSREQDLLRLAGR